MFLKIMSAEGTRNKNKPSAFSTQFIFIPHAFSARNLLKIFKEILKHPEKKLCESTSGKSIKLTAHLSTIYVTDIHV